MDPRRASGRIATGGDVYVLAAVLSCTIPGDGDRPVYAVAANRALYPGVTIGEADLYMVRMDPRFLPEGVFLDPRGVVGRIPRERILANELVRSDRMADPESGVGLNAVIPRGMRAVSIDLAGALPDACVPGAYVDVVVRLPDPPTAKTFLKEVFVFAVSDRLPDQVAVVLLVNAEQAEHLAHWRHLGELVLVPVDPQTARP
jgi:Flp pilus assembly protein CpaB